MASDTVSTGNNLKGLEDEIDAKDYYAYLHEAQQTDLSEIERTRCVSSGKDIKDNPVIVLIPVLGVGASQNLDAAYRLMLLLFIRKTNEIVNTNYSVIYAHTHVDIINQYPLIYKFYSVLPRTYKKNLHKMYVIHPNIALKMFFEFARVFLSHKFYSKLVLLDSILDFQKLIPPTQMRLPLKFLRKEDEIRGLEFCGRTAPLSESFDASIGTTRFMHVCAEFLKANGALQMKGLFRVSGDDGEVNLVRVRMQFAHQRGDYTERVQLSENNEYILVGDLGKLSHVRPRTLDRKFAASVKIKAAAASSSSGADVNRAAGSGTGGGEGNEDSSSSPEYELPEEEPMSVVLISNVHTVSQMFKMAIGTLAVPLVSNTCYQKLIDATRRSESANGGGLNADWETAVATAISELSHESISTLVYCIQFLREVAAMSNLNSMDSSNLAIVFAPTIFRPDMIDPMKAVMEMKLSKLIIRELIDRLSVLQKAMHIYSDRRRASGIPDDAATGRGGCFIFENPIMEYDNNVLSADLAGKMKLEDVRGIMDNFGARFQSRIQRSSPRTPTPADEPDGDTSYDERSDPRVSIHQRSIHDDGDPDNGNNNRNTYNKVDDKITNTGNNSSNSNTGTGSSVDVGDVNLDISKENA
mmetsp:Transcript_16521/g.27702  ORF Transcript_16521/g.27702 Transcript_16521/m.27702 type:complete len:640 (-) Transcript_16521:974-2893(-)